MSKIYSIEGNIGSGKTTLLKRIRTNYGGNCICIEEPTTLWNRIMDSETGKTKIEMLYDDMKSNAFSFQIMAFTSRIHVLRSTINAYPNRVIITDRSIFTDRYVFAPQLYSDGFISETDFEIYCKLFDEFVNDVPEIEFIYLKTSPEICKLRIENRGRESESNISLDYLKGLHRRHEEWLNNSNCKNKINGNIERNKMSDYNDIFSNLDQIILNPAELGRRLLFN
jgi:deoxyadenosine/deoxycytidine kinase